MKKWRKALLASILCGVMIASFQLNSFAASAQGSTTTKTVYGYTYSFYSSVGNDSTSTWSHTRIYTDTNTNVPTGYMGVYPRLYNSSGTLVKSDAWTYSSIICAGIMASSGSYSTSGTYYGKGQVDIYNGDGYTRYTCTASPNLQRSGAFIGPKLEAYEVNDAGLTYGSDYFAESIDECPDLIRAVGINGVEGYVYSDDINWKPGSLEEVIEYMGTEASDYTIPVYAVDGQTIVDYFLIESSD